MADDLIAKIDGIEKFQKDRTKGATQKLQWPSQEKCTFLKTEVKKVLSAIGAQGAYISDISMVGDFDGLWGVNEETSKEDAERIAKLKCREIAEKLQLGIDEVCPTTYIVEVAQKLK